MKNKKLIILLAALIIIVLFLVSVIRDFNGIAGGEIKEITIDQGESFSSALDKLKKENIIKHKLLFKYYSVRKSLDREIKAGNHFLSVGMGYENLIEELKNGGSMDNTLIFTVPEGYEISDIAREVENVFGISAEDFRGALEKDYDFPFLNDIGDKENYLEGYLFPDSYEFYKDASPEDIIKKMLEGFDKTWTEDFEKRAKELNMTKDEVIILASIIEREAGKIEEMGKVSSVFHNRLKINMPLQSCATVQYILKERKPVLSIADTKIDSPYNTYLYGGLPIGPISNPGKAAIEAALYPEKTDYFYFKVNDYGVTLFARTLSEHNLK